MTPLSICLQPERTDQSLNNEIKIKRTIPTAVEQRTKNLPHSKSRGFCVHREWGWFRVLDELCMNQPTSAATIIFASMHTTDTRTHTHTKHIDDSRITPFRHSSVLYTCYAISYDYHYRDSLCYTTILLYCCYCCCHTVQQFLLYGSTLAEQEKNNRLQQAGIVLPLVSMPTAILLVQRGGGKIDCC